MPLYRLPLRTNSDPTALLSVEPFDMLGNCSSHMEVL